MTDPISDEAMAQLRRFPDSCDATVSRGGEEQACEKPAVAAVLPDGEYTQAWAVCAHHARGKAMVPLRSLLAAPLLVSADSSAQAERRSWTLRDPSLWQLINDADPAVRQLLIEAWGDRDDALAVVEGLRAELARTNDAISEVFDVLRGMAQDIDISPVVRALEMPGSAARMAALRAAGGQEKPVCPLTEAGIEHRPHHYLTPVPWDCPGLPAAPVGGQAEPSDTRCRGTYMTQIHGSFRCERYAGHRGSHGAAVSGEQR